MDRLAEQLLACTALAKDHNIGIGLRKRIRPADALPNRRAFPDDTVKGVFRRMTLMVKLSAQLALGFLNLIGVQEGQHIADHFVAQINCDFLK